jgi:hypothetical protein
LLVRLELSCIKSEVGDHRAALSDLESLAPLTRFVARRHALYFYVYHNELAVEFAQLGRLAEAEAASAIALASPFAPAYPEWSQTRDEITAKRTSATPSVVAINRPAEVIQSPQKQPYRQVKLITVSWPARTEYSFQRSIFPIPARAAFQLINILQRMLTFLRPRAPPIFVDTL